MMAMAAVVPIAAEDVYVTRGFHSLNTSPADTHRYCVEPAGGLFPAVTFIDGLISAAPAFEAIQSLSTGLSAEGLVVIARDRGLVLLSCPPDRRGVPDSAGC